MRSLHAAVGDALRDEPTGIAAYHYGSSARRQPARDIHIGIVVERGAERTFETERTAERIAAGCGRAVGELDVRVLAVARGDRAARPLPTARR